MTVTPADLARTLLARAAHRRNADLRAKAACTKAVESTLAAMNAELGTARVWMIGSLAWGPFGVRSDVDVVIAGAHPELLRKIDDALGAATERAIDLLEFERLAPSFQERVLREGKRVA